MAEQTETELLKIVVNGTVAEKVRAVKLRTTPESVLERALIANPNVLEIIKAVFSRGSLSAAFIQRMYAKAKRTTEYGLRHPNCPAKLLEDVLLDKDESLKMKVLAATNKNLDFNGLTAAIDPDQPEEVRIPALRGIIESNEMFERLLKQGIDSNIAAALLRQDGTTYLMQDRLLDVVLDVPSGEQAIKDISYIFEKKKDLALGIVRRIAEYLGLMDPKADRTKINPYYLAMIFDQQNVPADLLLLALENKDDTIVKRARDKLCS